jgi:hypothetical protein
LEIEMTDLRKAAQAALIELDLIQPQYMGAHVYRVREALRAALAQPEPAPWTCACGANLYIAEDGSPRSKAAQPQQEPARLRRFLIDIRDTGMTAEQMVQHAADALDGQQEPDTVAVRLALPVDWIEGVQTANYAPKTGRVALKSSTVIAIDVLLKDA